MKLDPALTLTSSARASRRLLENAKLGPVVFMGVDPNYALGPEEWLPTYRVVCRHETAVLRLLEQAEVEVFCLERAVGRDQLPGRATAGLAGHPAVLAWLKDVERREGPLSLLVFKPNAQVEALARENGWRILGAPASIARPLENKVSFFHLLDELKLPHPPWEEVDLGPATYADLADRLGPELVVQGAHGFSGNRTFAVDDAVAFDAARVHLRQRRARVSARVPGVPATLNACVMDDGALRMGRLFHQVTGTAECTVYPLGACGNDWAAAPFIEAVQWQAASITQAVGRVLHQRGFRGIFGMDFVVTPIQSVTTIEINPRLVSSIPMATRLEASRSHVPMLVYHLLATSGAPTPDVPTHYRGSSDSDYPRLRGAQMVLHNLSGGAARVHGALAAGIYVLEGHRLEYLRPSFQVDHCAPTDEFLVLPPAEGHLLAVAGECARVQMLRPVLEFAEDPSFGPGRLNEEAHAIAKAVYAALDLRPVQGMAAEEEE